MAHTCNPSYSGGRDQEHCDLKPAPANSSGDPTSKNTSQKRAGGVAQAEHIRRIDNKTCYIISKNSYSKRSTKP
jgi:hypothetical protein